MVRLERAVKVGTVVGDGERGTVWLRCREEKEVDVCVVVENMFTISCKND